MWNKKLYIKALMGIACLFLLIPAAAGQTACSKLDESQVDAEMKEKACELGSNLFLSYEKEEFKLMGDEATEEMQGIFTIEKQKKDHKAIKQAYGAFESMYYIETWINESAGLIIFRFRANFSGITNKPEVRVVFDNDGKLSGFWLMPWKDEI
jgi:hypothetical protein